jgi:hypothetical protein
MLWELLLCATRCLQPLNVSLGAVTFEGGTLWDDATGQQVSCHFLVMGRIVNTERQISGETSL